VFERYTGQARRSIFYARYEASRYGSPHIDTEHLLLGMLRETKGKLGDQGEWFRAEIEKSIKICERIPTSVEIPLTDDCKRALTLAHEEADLLKSRYIGPEHMLMGIVRTEKGLAARLLRERGVHLEDLRSECAKNTTNEDEEEGARVTRWSGGAEQALNGFLEALRSEGATANFGKWFTEDARLIDSSGQVWVGTNEIAAHSAEIFAPYVTKRASYRIEDSRIVRSPFLHATILWEMPGSGGNARGRQRMTIAIVEGAPDRWNVYFVQVTPVA
jgi:uncharacterized protein (TIGR02246 family)